MEEWILEILGMICGIMSNIWQALVGWEHLAFWGLVFDVVGFLGITILGAPNKPKNKYWGYNNKLGIFIDKQARKINESCPDHLRIASPALVVIGFMMQALGACRP